MRLLVTGGAGYVGSICAAVLRDRGHHVVVVDDLSTGHAWAAGDGLVVADVRDRLRIIALLRDERIDAVLHFAARAIVGDSVADPIGTWDVNVGGTIALIDAMRTAGVHRLVFSSTCAIYGDPMRLPVHEDHPRLPTSPYGASKHAVELLLDGVRGPGFGVASLRYFNAAGAWPERGLGEAHPHETHLIPLAMAAALGEGPPLAILGDDWPTVDGTCVRDYVHVLDLAEAHALALDHLAAGAAGGAWNLGTGRGVSVREVLDAIGRVIGPVPTVAAPRRSGDPASVYAASGRAARELGWSARRGIDEMVRSAAEWERVRMR